MVDGDNLPAQGPEPLEHQSAARCPPKAVSGAVPIPRARKDSEVFVTEAFKEENHW